MRTLVSFNLRARYQVLAVGCATSWRAAVELRYVRAGGAAPSDASLWHSNARASTLAAAFRLVGPAPQAPSSYLVLLPNNQLVISSAIYPVGPPPPLGSEFADVLPPRRWHSTKSPDPRLSRLLGRDQHVFSLLTQKGQSHRSLLRDLLNRICSRANRQRLVLGMNRVRVEVRD